MHGSLDPACRTDYVLSRPRTDPLNDDARAGLARGGYRRLRGARRGRSWAPPIAGAMLINGCSFVCMGRRRQEGRGRRNLPTSADPSYDGAYHALPPLLLRRSLAGRHLRAQHRQEARAPPVDDHADQQRRREENGAKCAPTCRDEALHKGRVARRKAQWVPGKVLRSGAWGRRGCVREY